MTAATRISYRYNGYSEAIILCFLLSPSLSIKLGVSLKFWMIMVISYLAVAGAKRTALLSERFLITMFFFTVVVWLSIGYAETLTPGQMIYAALGPIQIFFAYLAARFIGEEALKKGARLFVFVTLASGALGAATLPAGLQNNEVHFGLFMQYNKLRLSGTVGDPNMLAFYSSALLCSLSREKMLGAKFGLTLIVLLAQSRTGFAFLILYAVYSAVSSHYLKKYVAFLSAFLGALLYHFSAEVVDYFGGRLSDLERLGGRIKFWETAIERILDDPLTGVGFGGARNFVDGVHGSATYLHNTFLEVLLELGLFVGGLTLCILCLLFSTNLLIARRRWDLLLLISIYGSSLSLSVNEIFWFTLFSAVLPKDFQRPQMARPLQG